MRIRVPVLFDSRGTAKTYFAEELARPVCDLCLSVVEGHDPDGCDCHARCDECGGYLAGGLPGHCTCAAAARRAA